MAGTVLFNVLVSLACVVGGTSAGMTGFGRSILFHMLVLVIVTALPDDTGSDDGEGLEDAVAILAIQGVCIMWPLVVVARKDFNPALAVLFCVPSVIGTVLGTAVLVDAPQGAIRLAMGVCLFAFATWRWYWVFTHPPPAENSASSKQDGAANKHDDNARDTSNIQDVSSSQAGMSNDQDMSNHQDMSTRHVNQDMSTRHITQDISNHDDTPDNLQSIPNSTPLNSTPDNSAHPDTPDNLQSIPNSTPLNSTPDNSAHPDTPNNRQSIPDSTPLNSTPDNSAQPDMSNNKESTQLSADIPLSAAPVTVLPASRAQRDKPAVAGSRCRRVLRWVQDAWPARGIAIGAAVAGLCSGFGGGLVGVAGPPIMVYVALAGLDKSQIRATFAFVTALSSSVQTANLMVVGVIQVSSWSVYLGTTGGAIIGLIVGSKLHHKLSAAGATKAVLFLLSASAAALLGQGHWLRTLLAATALALIATVCHFVCRRRTRRVTPAPTPHEQPSASRPRPTIPAAPASRPRPTIPAAPASRPSTTTPAAPASSPSKPTRAAPASVVVVAPHTHTFAATP